MDGTVRFWDPATGQAAGAVVIPTGQQLAVEAVAFSPDGRLLVTGNDGTVRFWDPATGQPVGPPSQPAR